MRRRRAVLAVAVAAVLTMPACGDGDGGGGGGPPLSDAAFVEAADALCSDASSDIEKAVSDINLDDGPTPEEVRELARRTTSHLDRLVTDLGKLRPPTEKAARYRDYLAEMRKGRDAIRQASTSNSAAQAFVNTGVDPFEEADATARELGLDECATEI